MTILIAQHDQQAVSIPEWVVDLASFRRWASSDEFPNSGWYAHLNGKLWVDGSMERLEHNEIKTEFAVTLGRLVKSARSGKFLGDRMLLTNVAAALSTEPDGMFVSYQSLKTEKLTFVKGPDSLEAVGTPDLVLEVVSPTSRHKDTVIVRDLYHRAGISEYWLVEPLRWEDEIAFEILSWAPTGYVPVAKQDGWTESRIFQQGFRLTRGVDPIGGAIYNLEVRGQRQ